jgi:Kdo2-lipid IVA lauroyltransferase/acyltransferase
VRERLEYALVWPWVKSWACSPARGARHRNHTRLTVYAVHGRLRRVGLRNLALAFPEMSNASAAAWFAENSSPSDASSPKSASSPATPAKTSPGSSSTTAFENFERAYARGKGVLFLTGHLGAWELSAFAHSLQGHPLSIVMRSLDNPYIDALSSATAPCTATAPSTKTISSAACSPPCAPEKPSAFSWIPT